MAHGTHLSDALDGFADALPWKSLSACPEQGHGNGFCYGQSVTLRGMERKHMLRLVKYNII